MNDFDKTDDYDVFEEDCHEDDESCPSVAALLAIILLLAVVLVILAVTL